MIVLVAVGFNMLVRLYMEYIQMSAVVWREEKNILDSLELEYELPDIGSGQLNVDPLQEQYKFLTTEPSL